MHSIFSFLLIPLLIASANLIEDDEVVFQDDEIVLDNDSTLDLSSDLETVTETTETIGGQEVDLNKEVTIVSSQAGGEVILRNTELTTVRAEIPDGTKVSGPTAWNGEITPPKQVSTSGSVTGNFLTPTSSILVGSPDVILVFDESVTILLSGVTGQTAYKTPGSNNWILISGCTGTYEAPNDPPANGECSISNGADTKIITFHFTEFTGLSTPPATETSTTSSSSGGHGNTGVGSPRVFGPSSSGSSGGSGGYYGPIERQQSVFPTWFDDVTDWYREGKISATEFLNAYQWIIENVLK